MFQTLTIGPPALKNIFSRAIEFRLPKTTDAHVVGKKALRFGASVGTNYRRVYRARTNSKFIALEQPAMRRLCVLSLTVS
jgi:hypothetical protein